MIKKSYVIVAVIAIAALAIFAFARRENYAQYPVKNTFMNIYYDDIAEDPSFEKKFPFYGTGTKAGLRCRGPNNKDCDTMWVSSKLVEITPQLIKGLECKYGMPFTKILTDIV